MAGGGLPPDVHRGYLILKHGDGRVRFHSFGEPMKTLPFAVLALTLAACGTPTTVTFESVSLPDSGFLDGSGTHPGLTVDGVTFASTYETTYFTSSGTTFSRLTDRTTAGYTNAHSAFPGSGAGGSTTFAVLNPFGEESPLIAFADDVAPVRVEVANTTYAALSMENGDQFAKKFTRDAGDHFDVIFTGLRSDGGVTGTVTASLADFRGSSSPGILRTWATIDLSGLGAVRKIDVSFQSSDVGSYGINTPLYVAIDNLTYYP
jgi:hypothetical protein